MVPSGKSRDSWHLRCTGDQVVPDGLEVSKAEKSAGIRRCWTTETIGGVEQRMAFPRRDAPRAEQEIEFVNDRIVRIKRTYFFSGSVQVHETITCATDEAAAIDRLASTKG